MFLSFVFSFILWVIFSDFSAFIVKIVQGDAHTTAHMVIQVV